MNNQFVPQNIKKAAKYLDKKLNSFKQPYKNAYDIKEKKKTFFSRFINSVFK